jgi:transposase
MIHHLLKFGVGLDVSEADLEAAVALMNTEGEIAVVARRSFANRPNGFKALQSWLNKQGLSTEQAGVILLEATGVYYEQCALSLQQADLGVCVTLANKAKRYMQALGLRSKTDRIDAQGLVMMAAGMPMSRWVPLDGFWFPLRGLTRQHQSLQEFRTQLRNQLHAHSRSIYRVELVEQQLNATLAGIEGQLKELEGAKTTHLQSKPEVWRKVQLLQSIKGVGILCVAVLLAETNGFGLITSARQLISYAGYDVVENQSGSRHGKTRISKKGNGRIRRILHMPALNAVRFQGGVFADLFDCTYARYGIKMKSYVGGAEEATEHPV